MPWNVTQEEIERRYREVYECAMRTHSVPNVGEHTELSLTRKEWVWAQDQPGPLDSTVRELLAAPQQTERARLLYEAENRANEFVMQGDALVEAVLYKLLYARGMRMATVDQAIQRALDQRLGIRR